MSLPSPETRKVKPIKEHDCVVLTTDLPAEKLEAGDVGTVVHIHKDGAAYEVEFMTLDGPRWPSRRSKARNCGEFPLATSRMSGN